MVLHSHGTSLGKLTALVFLAVAFQAPSQAGGFEGGYGPKPNPAHHHIPSNPPTDPYACSRLLLNLPGSPRIHDISAHLGDGRILEGKSRICRETPEDSMQVKLQGREIHPGDTRFIKADGEHGLPNGPDWIFPAVQGRIAAYRRQPGGEGRIYDFLQKEGGSIEPYTERLLAGMVQDHSVASGYMARKAWGVEAFWGLTAVAGILFVTASQLSGVEHKDANGFTYRTSYRANGVCVVSGIGLVLTGAGFYWFTRDNHFSALEAYNTDSEAQARP